MIKWITNNLGTASCDVAMKHENVHIIDTRDMVDKSGNLTDLVKRKIDEAIFNINNGKKVVICCDYGISRSNAIASGILSMIESISFDDAVCKVISITGASIKIDVLSVVRKACNSNNTTFNNENDNNNHILVLGGHGFIGTNLVPKLHQHYTIFTPSHKDINILKDVIELDILVKKLNIEQIVYLVSPEIYNNISAMGDIIVGLKNAIDVCIENDVKLIYLSSWEVYSGYKSHSLIVSESTPKCPKGQYGEAKYLCEILLEHYKYLHNLRYILIRSVPIYGNSGDKPKFIFNFIKKAVRNEDIVTHKYINGFPYLDMLHIDDFIPLIISIIDNDYYGEINVGSGIGISTNEVAHLIVRLLSSTSKIKHQYIDTYASNIVMDYSLAHKLFKWSPKITIKDGLQRLINENYIIC